MKTFKIVAFLIAASGLVLQGSLVLAQEFAQPESLPQVQVIQRQCTSIKVLLKRLHTSDAVLRVNIGQTYNQISSQLMAHLNARLAVNQVDSSQFVEITKHYDQLLGQFSEGYRVYEEATARLIEIDCALKPTEFYAQLIKVRDTRQILAGTVKEMNRTINSYRAAVEELRQRLGAKNG